MKIILDPKEHKFCTTPSWSYNTPFGQFGFFGKFRNTTEIALVFKPNDGDMIRKKLGESRLVMTAVLLTETAQRIIEKCVAIKCDIGIMRTDFGFVEY